MFFFFLNAVLTTAMFIHLSAYPRAEDYAEVRNSGMVVGGFNNRHDIVNHLKGLFDLYNPSIEPAHTLQPTAVDKTTHSQ